MLLVASVVGLDSESLTEFLNLNTDVLCTDRLFLGDPHALAECVFFFLSGIYLLRVIALIFRRQACQDAFASFSSLYWNKLPGFNSPRRTGISGSLISARSKCR